MSDMFNGSEPYIFISYSHKDSELVLQIIHDLQAQGFRIWYDNQIEGGTEWPEYIAAHLRKAECVISFISPSFVDSRNCRRELIFAQELNKPMLSVYLTDVALSDGMRMQLGLNQAIYRNKFASYTDFCKALSNAVILQACRTPAESPEPPQTADPVPADDPSSAVTETQPAEPEKKDKDVPPLPEPLKRKSKKLLTFCSILEFLSIPLTLAAMHFVTMYVQKWWLAALLLCIPHVLIGIIILNRINSFRKAYPETAEACDFSVFLAVWLLVIILTICLSYFYIHYPVNFLLKILISLGLNLLPTIVTFFMYTLGM